MRFFDLYVPSAKESIECLQGLEKDGFSVKYYNAINYRRTAQPGNKCICRHDTFLLVDLLKTATCSIRAHRREKHTQILEQD